MLLRENEPGSADHTICGGYTAISLSVLDVFFKARSQLDGVVHIPFVIRFALQSPRWCYELRGS